MPIPAPVFGNLWNKNVMDSQNQQQPWQQPRANERQAPLPSALGDDLAQAGVPLDNSVNGTLILLLGAVGLVAFQLLGPFVWFMGNRALAKLERGIGDPAQRPNVVVGRLLGIITTVLLIAGIIVLACAVFFFLFMARVTTPDYGGARLITPTTP